MKIIKSPDKLQWPDLLKRPVLESVRLETEVELILNEVRQKGDSALRVFTRRFDGVELIDIAVKESEFNEAEMVLSKDLKNAMALAKLNIECFHRSQREEIKVVETMPGVKCWRKSVGIEKIGLYIPGGTAPLFSTVLMLGIPAQIAGCKEVFLCSPPDKSGRINPAILYAAQLVGIKNVFKVGGAQAIAAMGYGTESVMKADKIFGPGNQYVTSAKQLVSKNGVAIDMPAGPSELLVWADDSGIPEFVAADLLSQAEHGPDSQVILVTKSERLIKMVVEEIQKQVEMLPRKEIAKMALENSKCFLMDNDDDVIELINEYAPEHLIIACEEDQKWAEKIINAGSVFLGNYSCESAGDYASGTNHTLPTNGYAKGFSGVSIDSFVKKITFQKISMEGLRRIGGAIELMAEAEGLLAHKEAVSRRLNQIK